MVFSCCLTNWLLTLQNVMIPTTIKVNTTAITINNWIRVLYRMRFDTNKYRQRRFRKLKSLVLNVATNHVRRNTHTKNTRNTRKKKDKLANCIHPPRVGLLSTMVVDASGL